MNRNEVRRIITFLGIEDFSGLWEITWEKGLFEMSPAERIQIASNAIEELLSEGALKLYRCQEPDRQLEEINEEEWDSVLSDPESWMEPKRDSVSIRFGTTSVGKGHTG